MRLFKILSLAGGIAIFLWIILRADLSSVAAVVGRMGAGGAAIVAGAFGVAMILGAWAWSLTLRSVISAVWTARLWLVMMVGEAFNMLTPLGAFGGEPFKALLLNRHYGVSYSEATASLVLVQTVNSLAQVPFAIIGAALVLANDGLPDSLETGIVAATAVIAAAMMLIYLLLHFRVLARLPAMMQDNASAAGMAGAAAFLIAIEERLFHFIRRTPGRFAAAVLLAFLSWVIGVVEIMLVFAFLDVPITFAQAWIVETVIVLVRSATFFVPAHIGVQDGALTLVGRAIGGSHEIGLALALIRRGRELFWAGIGLLIYAGYNLRDRK